MPTRRVELNKDHIAEAKAAAAARTYTSRDPLIFAHVGEKGLQLRVQDGTASWILKFNGSSKSLGKLTEVTTVKAAVERAQHVRAVMRRGEDAGEYLVSLGKSNDHAGAAATAASRKARADGMWTWKELAAAYREQYLSKPKAKKTGVKPPSDRTVQDFDRYTSTPAFADLLDDVLVRDMTPELVEKIRNAVQKTNGLNGGRKAVQWISGALTWGQREHKLYTGLGSGFQWWKGVSPGHVPGTRTRYLTLEQIAKVLYAAERYRQMPYRQQAKPATDSVLSALWWIVLTAQRTSASMMLLSSRIIPDKDNPGWMIANFPDVDMKSKRYHALPIPPRVALLFDRAKIGLKQKSQWAFTSAKVRRAGIEQIDDIRVHDSSVGQLIDRLRGKDDVSRKLKAEDERLIEEGKEPSGRVYDLLAGVPEFSPHDLRRSLTTILSDLKVRGDAASAVLDHSSDTPGQTEFREADITRMAYNQSQRLPLKSEAMTIWTDAVFEAVEKEWAANRPAGSATGPGMRRPVAPPSREVVAKHKEDRQKCIFTSAGPWYLYYQGSGAAAPKGLNLGAIRNLQDEAFDEEDAA